MDYEYVRILGDAASGQHGYADDLHRAYLRLEIRFPRALRSVLGNLINSLASASAVYRYSARNGAANRWAG